MNRVAIQPRMIAWARERSGLDVAVLMRRFPAYEAWERGEKQPTFNQLEDLAKKTLTPLGYFFLDEPPEEKLPVPDFRTFENRPLRRASPNLLETIYTMQRRQEWMREYLAGLGAAPLEFVGWATDRTSALTVARAIRETLGLGDGWAQEHATWEAALIGLRRTIEAAGVLVIVNGVVGNNNRRKLDPGEFRGFVLCDRLAPLIFVNGADFKSAQMFTLAHELAHLWLGEDGIFNLPELQPGHNETERHCNAIAAEVLVPEEELRRYWPAASRSVSPVKSVARNFKVSPLVASRRMLDAGLISRDAYIRFLREHEKDEARKAVTAKARSGGGDFYLTQENRVGRRFGRAVSQAAREGTLLMRDAYRLTGLSGRTFERFTKGLSERIGG
jgi:Zn-dependent peptidase ImmA (M78 family)